MLGGANADQTDAFFYGKSNHFHGSYRCGGITAGNCQPVGSAGNHWALVIFRDLFTKSGKKAMSVFPLGGCVVSGVS